MMSVRSLATRRVMKTIARRLPMQPLPVRLADGTTPVIVTEPDDKLNAVATRVEHEGGRANVFVAFPDHLALIDFSVDSVSPILEQQQKAHQETSMSMYVAFLKHSPGERITVSMSSTAADAAAVPAVQDIAYAF